MISKFKEIVEMYKVQYNRGITFSLLRLGPRVGTMVSAVNTPTIPKYHKPLDWTTVTVRPCDVSLLIGWLKSQPLVC
jgi:hypothetical protein